MEAAAGRCRGSQGLLYLELRWPRTGPHLCSVALRGRVVLHHGIILDSIGDQHQISASAPLPRHMPAIPSLCQPQPQPVVVNALRGANLPPEETPAHRHRFHLLPATNFLLRGLLLFLFIVVTGGFCFVLLALLFVVCSFVGWWYW